MNGQKMKTGTDAEVSGLYVSECCDHEASFVTDQTFTRCMKCSGLTTWELLEADLRMAARSGVGIFSKERPHKFSIELKLMDEPASLVGSGK
jgi:hypothetical protein